MRQRTTRTHSNPARPPLRAAFGFAWGVPLRRPRPLTPPPKQQNKTPGGVRVRPLGGQALHHGRRRLPARGAQLPLPLARERALHAQPEPGVAVVHGQEGGAGSEQGRGCFRWPTRTHPFRAGLTLPCARPDRLPAFRIPTSPQTPPPPKTERSPRTSTTGWCSAAAGRRCRPAARAPRPRRRPRRRARRRPRPRARRAAASRTSTTSSEWA